MDISGRVVLITGASAGIGLATARRFAEAGARLSLVARSTDALNKLVGELRDNGAEAVAVTADLSKPEQVTRAVKETIQHYGRIDILINNAGQAAAGTVADVNPEHFQQIIDLNIFGPLIAMQAAIPSMREHGGGLIINISSMVSRMHIPGLAAYAATKVALNMLSDTARVELAPDNIRVVTVLPRLTTTDFQKHSLGDHERRRTQLDPSIPIDAPEHVAQKIIAAAINEPEEQYMDR